MEAPVAACLEVAQSIWRRNPAPVRESLTLSPLPLAGREEHAGRKHVWEVVVRIRVSHERCHWARWSANVASGITVVFFSLLANLFLEIDLLAAACVLIANSFGARRRCGITEVLFTLGVDLALALPWRKHQHVWQQLEVFSAHGRSASTGGARRRLGASGSFDVVDMVEFIHVVMRCSMVGD